MKKKCKCGKEIPRKRKYCGLSCRSKYGNSNKGRYFEKAHGWKGGIREIRGYTFIYQGKGKYKKQSRIIIEKHLKRLLSPLEFVHHKNGIRNDDRLENLTLTDLSNHVKHHRKEWAYIRDKKGRFTKVVRRKVVYG